MKPMRIALFLVLALSGCATFSLKYEERSASGIIDLINGGKAEALADLSALPFLFDAEMLLAREDVETLWKNLVASGFSLPNPRIVHIEPAAPDLSSVFSDSKEVEVFFKKYVPQRSSFLSVQSDEGEFFFVLAGLADGKRKIVAFKGPVQ
jgi:hypothetical protein